MRKCRIIKPFLFLFLIAGVSVLKAQTDSGVIDSLPPPVEHVLDTALIVNDSMPTPMGQDSLDNNSPDAGYIPLDPNVGVQPYGTSLEGLSLRMITGQTTHVLNKKVLEFCVQHRFGYFSGGKDNFYGFDQSDVRLGFDYGVTKKITLGVGRSSLGKVFNGYAKWALVKQGDKSPVNVTWLSDMYISGLKNTDPDLDPFYPSHRYKYVNQVLISRTFGERFYLSVAPTMVHKNLVDSTHYPNDMPNVVVNGRLKLVNGLNITGEYNYLFNHDMRKLYTPTMSMGIEIYTTGHIFQIVFTNCNSMNEADAYAMKNGKFSAGDIRMGFNIVRQF